MFKERQFLFTTSWKLAKLYEKALHKLGSEYKLTQCEMDVLLFLEANAPLNTSRDIANYRSISKSLICKSVSGLTDKGLIESVGDGIDARVIRLNLTEKGKNIALRLLEESNVLCEELCSGISNSELQIISSVSERMVTNGKEKYHL